MEEYIISKCNECGSDYYTESSQMSSLCPNCAFHLYNYPNCEHKFKTSSNRCVNCYWDGSKSKYIKSLVQESKN